MICAPPAHSLGIMLYGALAIAYDHLGTEEQWQVYEEYASASANKLNLFFAQLQLRMRQTPPSLNGITGPLLPFWRVTLPVTS